MFSRLLYLSVPLFVLALIPLDPIHGQEPNPSSTQPPYRIDDLRVHSAIRHRDGKSERYVTVEFPVKRTSDGEPVAHIAKEELKVLLGNLRHRLPIASAFDGEFHRDIPL